MDQENTHEEAAVLNTLLATAGRQDPFAVPAGYFHDLPGQVMSRIRLDELAAAHPADLQVPEGYFNELPGRIHQAVFLAGLPVTAADEHFAVPPGYFETLAGKITAKTAPVQKTAKVRSLYSRIGYAAAACITIALATTLLLNQHQPTVDEQLSKIPDQAIIQYLQVHSDPGDTEFIKQNIDDASGLPAQDASEKDIQQYLDSTL